MNKKLAAALCFCSMCAVSLVWADEISGYAAERQREGGYMLDLADFTDIAVRDGACDVILTQGSEFRVYIDEVYAQRAKITRSGRSVKFGTRFFHLPFTGRGLIEITSPDVEKFSVSGSSTVNFDGPWRFAEVDVSHSGAGELRFDAVSAERISIRLSGSANVVMPSLACQSLDYGVSGHSNGEFGTLQADSVDFRCSGSGTITIDNVSCSEMEYKNSGSGSLNCGNGYADDLRVKVSGSARVDMRNVPSKNVYVDVSGGCKLYLNVSERLTGKTSGACTIYYNGSPDVQVSSTGIARIRPLREE